MLEALVLGVSLGFAAGISPGPLLTLVFTAAMQRGFRAGAAVSLAPVLTDLPILAVVLLLLSRMPAGFLRWLGVAGGLYVIWLGVHTVLHLRDVETVEAAGKEPVRRDLLRGALVNLLNPNAWLFWLGVGGLQITTSWSRHPAEAIVFLGSFWALIVGCKMAFAAVVARGRGFVAGRGYRVLLGVAAVLLLVMGAWIVRRSWSGALLLGAG